MCAPDEGWRFYDGRCYYFGGGGGSDGDSPAAAADTFYGAAAWCRGQGGDLVSIPNEDTQRFISGQVADIQTYDLWIGLNELDGQGYT